MHHTQGYSSSLPTDVVTGLAVFSHLFICYVLKEIYAASPVLCPLRSWHGRGHCLRHFLHPIPCYEAERDKRKAKIFHKIIMHQLCFNHNGPHFNKFFPFVSFSCRFVGASAQRHVRNICFSRTHLWMVSFVCIHQNLCLIIGDIQCISFRYVA